jgi:hypothetical protein
VSDVVVDVLVTELVEEDVTVVVCPVVVEGDVVVEDVVVVIVDVDPGVVEEAVVE